MDNQIEPLETAPDQKIFSLDTEAPQQMTEVPDGQRMLAAMQLADSFVNKGYLAHLDQARIVEPDSRLAALRTNSICRFFKIDRIAYDNEENVQDNLTSVFSAVAGLGSSVALIIDCDGNNVDFYLGVADVKKPGNTSLSYKTLRAAFEGNFSGSTVSTVDAQKLTALTEGLFSHDGYVISSVSGIASLKREKDGGGGFAQGLEKLTEAMRGRPYAAVILADAISDNQLAGVRDGYESLYSQLSPFARSDVTLSTGDMRSFATSATESVSDTVSRSVGMTQNYSATSTSSTSKNKTTGTTTNEGGVVGSAISAAAGIGAFLIGGGPMAFMTSSIASAVGNTAAGALGSQTTNEGETFTQGSNETKGTAEQKTEGRNRTKGTTKGTTDSQTVSTGRTLQLSYENRSVRTLLEAIDSQLERLKSCEEFGLFNCAAYFISGDSVTSRIAANTYRALTLGEKSSVECSHISTWWDPASVATLNQYLSKFTHPVFAFDDFPQMPQVTAGSLVNGRELAIHMSLPKKSLPGLPVLSYADFARNVVRYGTESGRELMLGTVFHMGKMSDTQVLLQTDSFTRHTLITGTTGSGKSNTLYILLARLRAQGVHFMVVEPAKGEYKDVFGGLEGVKVYGTNPTLTPMLRINPFVFPEGVHVLEHIDRLVELFNACWPMYAAMPAILKESVEAAYRRSGWDFDEGVCLLPEPRFPSFQDVLDIMPQIISQTSYSQEVQGNYIGSLVTRVKTLASGLYRQIFCDDELDSATLFDSDVIVDLSRLGSEESKSLLMGVLVMRLQEYRMTSARGHNRGLKHITVLEEAHHLLRRTSLDQSQEGANLMGKSVEMISNAIAEIRTFGEGFIIADQSPCLLDMSVIRNTNTKIILRLPDEQDRIAVGRASGLSDAQIQELARLQTGVAAVSQSDWVAPVLCKVDEFPEESAAPYRYVASACAEPSGLKADVALAMRVLLLPRLPAQESAEPQADELTAAAGHLRAARGPGLTELAQTLEEYAQDKHLALWEKPSFDALVLLVDSIFNSEPLMEAARMEGDPLRWNSYADRYIARKSAPMTPALRREVLSCLFMRHAKADAYVKKYFFKWYSAVSPS